MMRKLLVLISFAAGYVAGAAAGRERYEQIRSLVLGVAHDPTVQKIAGEAADFAQEQRAAVTEKITGQASASGIPEQPSADVNTALRL